MNLRDHFINIIKLDKAGQIFDKVQNIYNQSGLDYHNWKHVEFVMSKNYVISDPILFVAALYHDIIYVPGNIDNEERSAAYAQNDLIFLNMSPAFIQLVSHNIIMTHHWDTSGINEWHLSMTSKLLDADLYGLADFPEKYDGNSKNIRNEFVKLTDAEWKKGRTKFLKEMLLRKRIFTSGVLPGVAESNARENMIQELLTYI